MFGLKLIKQSDYDKLLINNQKVNIVEQVNTVVLARFERETYDELERKVSNILVSNQTSDIEAGFKLGVQHVLKALRDGYVIQRGN